MKEITREEWEKNPTPRMMWVWDDFECQKEKRKVIYLKKSNAVLFRVVTVSDDEQETSVYTHCAEIEELKRMTNYEVAKWIAYGTSCGELREWRYKDATMVFHDYSYAFEEENEPCGNIEIRSDGGEWREPLKECEE